MLMRPDCHDGVIVAGGMSYWGPWMCDCNLSLVGLIGLAPADYWLGRYFSGPLMQAHAGDCVVQAAVGRVYRARPGTAGEKRPKTIWQSERFTSLSLRPAKPGPVLQGLGHQHIRRTQCENERGKARSRATSWIEMTFHRENAG